MRPTVNPAPGAMRDVARIAAEPIPVPVRTPLGPHELAVDGGPSVGAEPVPDDHVVVLFGGTGDLARRKLCPACSAWRRQGCCHTTTAPSPLPRQPDRLRLSRAREDSSGGVRPSHVRSFVADVRGQSLLRLAGDARGDGRRCRDRARQPYPPTLYLSVTPVALASVVSMLGASGLSENARVML